MKDFEKINKAYNSVFKREQLSIGVVIPIENYAVGAAPTMQRHVERVQLIEQLGFKALWIRDIPLNVPSFGDVGQTYDPFTYLGYLAGQTNDIALGIASIALPLHHPLNIAKSVATIDQLSGGRMLLGVASGDRLNEYPAMGFDHEKRGELFREAFAYIRAAQESFPILESNHYGNLRGDVDVLPKPTAHKIPMLMTGYSRQSLEWNVENADGWMNYPRHLMQQQYTITQWRNMVLKTQDYDKPFMQPLYVILENDDDFKPVPIQLGFKIGANYLLEYFNHLQEIGVNHIAINLRFNSRDMEETLEHLAAKVLPHFHTNKNIHSADRTQIERI